jgi:transposase
MMTELNIHTERVDDLPLLIELQRQMGLAQIVDSVIQPHGNRQGLSMGEMLTVWLGYILSEADHRMSEVEPWATQLTETLSRLFARPVQPTEFADDRLADALRCLSDDDVWAQIEQRLGARLIRVYTLPQQSIRLDSTAVAVHHDTEGHTLFRHGYSKDHRPDLAQFKVMLATLDPLGMPLTTLVVPGNEADEGLYGPALDRAGAIVGQGGCLYIGDAKMAALAIRAGVQARGDFYLVPLPQTGETPELLLRLLEPVWAKHQDLERVYAINEAGREAKLLAIGYEALRQQSAHVKGATISWAECLLVIYSPTLARKARRGLMERLMRAERTLMALTPPRGRGRQQWEDQESLDVAVQAVLKKHRVEGLLNVYYQREVETRVIRPYGDRPARTEERVRYVVHVERRQAAVTEARRRLGWRLYASNAPGEVLGLGPAVQAYRGAPAIEQGFRRLKGRPLGLRPLYVRREDHAKGLVRLLTLALRVLTVAEHMVRQRLQMTDGAEPNAALRGLYAGNPTRETACPTTERLLKAFRGITLTTIQLSDQTMRHITPLSALQQQILDLLDLSDSIYAPIAPTARPIPP